MNNWPTEEKDLQLAQYIIDKHLNSKRGGLEITEYVLEECIELHCTEPVWLVELVNAFQTKYGFQEGLSISRKVIAKCMINGATVH